MTEQVSSVPPYKKPPRYSLEENSFNQSPFHYVNQTNPYYKQAMEEKKNNY
jgi:hypothetical protein